MAKGFWLVKTEPEVYSIDDLRRDRVTDWDRVRNHQAKLSLRDGMRDGDRVLVYHSNAEPTGVVGVAVVQGQAIADETQFRKGDDAFEPRATREAPVWWARRLRFELKFAACVELSRLRDEPALAGMKLLARGNRLSVLPVARAEFERIERMGGA
jgi:predicted RNA-binding protein with PUA-like domain